MVWEVKVVGEVKVGMGIDSQKEFFSRLVDMIIVHTFVDCHSITCLLATRQFHKLDCVSVYFFLTINFTV